MGSLSRFINFGWERDNVEHRMITANAQLKKTSSTGQKHDRSTVSRRYWGRKVALARESLPF
jgi:hypothetical protein